jgi:hypothetical protein
LENYILKGNYHTQDFPVGSDTEIETLKCIEYETLDPHASGESMRRLQSDDCMCMTLYQPICYSASNTTYDNACSAVCVIPDITEEDYTEGECPESSGGDPASGSSDDSDGDESGSGSSDEEE